MKRTVKMNELYNDLYQRMNGFKPIRRNSKRKGETDWYYLDPRDAETISDMQQIDVASENTPNPKLKEILAYDMAENPENYYIWCTKGDDKVRGAHAEREGKIYNKYIPPEGGNPGEDYNCRCWAEPYQSDRVKQYDVAQVDISGLPQYAKNNESEIQNKNHKDEHYIFSKKMRNLLGYKESNNNYNKTNTSGGGIGALGMYQIRRDGLIDTGYLTKDNKWTGKNGIYSVEDFLNNPSIQEQILDEYMKVQYRYLSYFGETKYIGSKYKGLKFDFTITNTGLLAAIHRTGIDYMNKFFKHIEKDKNGMYYMDYGKLNDPDLKTKFLWIETRLREFEK